MVQNLPNFPAQMLTPKQKLGKQVAEQLQVSLGLYAHHFYVVCLPYLAASLSTWWTRPGLRPVHSLKKVMLMMLCFCVQVCITSKAASQQQSEQLPCDACKAGSHPNIGSLQQ